MRKSDSSEDEETMREEFPKNLESGKANSLISGMEVNVTRTWRRMGKVTKRG